MDALREVMSMLGHRRWDSMTEAEKEAHIRRMVAGQKRGPKRPTKQTKKNAK